MPAARAQVNGEWQADVTYDWNNARFSERFTFAGEADALHGSASFLGVARGVLEGRVDAAGVVFVTRTSETSGSGDSATAVVHRYRGRLAGDELRFVMQTEGGSSAHVPIEFVARRVARPRRRRVAEPSPARGRSAPHALRPGEHALHRDALGARTRSA